jgi:glutamate-5-semialdehyde dehydrogenase
MTDVETLIADVTAKARIAGRTLAAATDTAKSQALKAAAAQLRSDADSILAANAVDMAAGKAAGLSPAMLDRLKLDAGRIEGIAAAVDQVASLADPVGVVIDSHTQPNGLVMERVRVPIGVLGIIYESRPNVTADAAALGLRSGNAVILRGGTATVRSTQLWSLALLLRVCLPTRCSWCQHRTGRLSARCCVRKGPLT